MMGASASFTDGACRVMPHETTAKRVNRRIPLLFMPAKFAKSSHFAKIKPGLVFHFQEYIINREPVSAEQIGDGEVGIAFIVLFGRPP